MPSPRATRWSCGDSAASASGTGTRARAVIRRPAAPWTFLRSAFPSSRSASACESSSTREGPPGALKRLWAPWRMAWIGGSRPAAGCVFCTARDGVDDRAALVLLRGAHAFLILNAYPYAPGHLMAVTNRHLAAVGEAQPEKLTDAMTLLQRGAAPLRLGHSAEGFNVGLKPGLAAGAGSKVLLQVTV